MAESTLATPGTAVGSRWTWVSALRGTLRRPSIWLVVWGLEALLALAPALLLHAWMSGAIDHRYEPGSLLGNLDTAFRFDHRQEIRQLDASTGVLGAVLGLLAVLLGAFAAGGWLQAFLEPAGGRSLASFVSGGVRRFWRFLRMAVLTVLALSLVTWVVYGPAWEVGVLEGLFGIPAHDVARLETLPDERLAFLLTASQQGIYAVAFALVLVWGDFSRTRLALHGTSSALWAGICSAVTLVRHPVRTLRPMIGLFALEVGIVLGVGWFARAVEERLGEGGGIGGVAALLAVGQLVLMWRVVLRGSRYHAAVQVSREVVLPIARPDPWKASLGPPGGPRYPLGGDEFGMSL